MRDKLDSLFKAYDVRGVYPDELNDQLAHDIGLAFGIFVKEDRVIVGHDARLSSDKIFKAFSSGLIHSGKKIKYVGLVPTDVVYTMSGLWNLPGTMITASHNPKEWNGFKFCKAGSRPIGIETGLEDIKLLINISNGYSELSKFDYEDIFDEYVSHISSIVNPSTINKHINIGIDAANGVAGAFVPKLLDNYGINYSGIFLEPDGNFPNHPADPSNRDNLQKLIELVIDKNLDFGVAFDGDADRAVFVDHQGTVLSGSALTGIIGEWYLESYPKSKIVHNLNVSPEVLDYLSSKGAVLIRSRVGHSFIKQLMHEEDAIFGGEHSSHFYYKDNFYADSGNLTLLILLLIMSQKNKTLYELSKDYQKKFSSGEVNLIVEDTVKSINKLKEKFINEYDDLDGVSVKREDVWFNVRSSNTEPKIRINIEADTKEKLNETLELLKEVL